MSDLARGKSIEVCSVGGNTSSTSEPVCAARSTSLPCNSTADSPTPARSFEDMSADVALEEDPKLDPPQEGAKVLSSTIQHDTNDAESHQPSLEGILAMIESAVYPHCAVASSPAGSNTTESDHQALACAKKVDASLADGGITGKEAFGRAEEVEELEAIEDRTMPSALRTSHTPTPGKPVDVARTLEDGTTPTSHQRILDDAVVQDLGQNANCERNNDTSSPATDQSGSSSTPLEAIEPDAARDKQCNEVVGTLTTRDGFADLGRVKDSEEESRTPIQHTHSGDDKALVGDSICGGKSLMSIRSYQASGLTSLLLRSSFIHRNPSCRGGYADRRGQ